MTITAVIAAVFGLVLGSFVNALVWRLHEQGAGLGNEDRRSKIEDRESDPKLPVSPDLRVKDPQSLSILRGRSMCPDCKHQLAAKDLVPVFSWLWLRGRCRYCHKPISWQYPVVELLTAGLFAWSALVIKTATTGGLASLVGWLLILTLLVALTVYDLRWYLLPYKLSFAAIALAAALLAAWTALGMPLGTLGRHLLAAVLVGGFFWLLSKLKLHGREAFGAGDVPLGVLIGLLLGLRAAAVALELAFVIGSVVGLALMALKRKGFTDSIPFGPFLVAGLFGAYLYAPQIIDWYLRLNGVR